jgi:hypothetical protein
MPLGTKHEFTGRVQAEGSDLVLDLGDGRKWTLLGGDGLKQFLDQSVRVNGIRGEHGSLYVTKVAPA